MIQVTPNIKPRHHARLVYSTMCVSVLCLAALLPHIAQAAETGFSEWANPLTGIGNMITGPVALGFSVIGLSALAWSFIFRQGEVNEFIGKLAWAAIVIGVGAGAGHFLPAIFGANLGQTSLPTISGANGVTAAIIN